MFRIKPTLDEHFQIANELAMALGHLDRARALIIKHYSKSHIINKSITNLWDTRRKNWGNLKNELDKDYHRCINNGEWDTKYRFYGHIYYNADFLFGKLKERFGIPDVLDDKIVVLEHDYELFNKRLDRS